MKILVIGATGSIGLEVVDYAIAQGHDVRAVVRKSSNTKYLNKSAEIYVADITKTDELVGAVKDIDAVVFTHGVPSPTPATSESVNYGAVQNVLDALQGKKVAIALMTAIGVTTRQSSYNKSSQSGEWNSDWSQSSSQENSGDCGELNLRFKLYRIGLRNAQYHLHLSSHLPELR